MWDSLSHLLLGNPAQIHVLGSQDKQGKLMIATGNQRLSVRIRLIFLNIKKPSKNTGLFNLVQGVGFEPTKAEPIDLQSIVFDRFTNPAYGYQHGCWQLKVTTLNSTSDEVNIEYTRR